MKAKDDVFLALPCFFYDPTDVGNLISDSSAFSKSNMNFWNFLVHVLLKLCLENFEHYFASVWDDCNCEVVWAFFGIAFFGIGMKTEFFQSCGHCWVFQICWHIKCSTFTASSFRIWNSSAGIPSPPLALFIAMLSKAHLTYHLLPKFLLVSASDVISMFDLTFTEFKHKRILNSLQRHCSITLSLF